MEAVMALCQLSLSRPHMRLSDSLLRFAVLIGVVVAAGCDPDVDAPTAPAGAPSSPAGPNASIANLTTAPIRYSQTSALNDLRAFTGDTIPMLMADDFVVPAGQEWTITAVSLTGNLYATALPLSIRPDVNGLPGAPLPNADYSLPATASDPNECGCTYWAGFAITDYLFPLPTPLTLTAGTYWLAARTGDPGDVLIFNWQAHVPAVGSGSALWGIVGRTWVLASQPGDNTFAVFGTAKPTQAITFTSAVPKPVYPAQSYTVSATGGPSGNPVTFSSLTPTICSVSGSNVQFLGRGDCTVAANQAGNASYGAALQATQTIVVTGFPQTITFAPLPPASAIVGSRITLTATGGATNNPVTFAVVTPNTCFSLANTVTLTSPGPCTMYPFQAGNAIYEPASTSITIAVLWPFTGFVGLAAEPAVNTVRAGSTVALSFSLGDNWGVTNILAAGSPTVAPYVCNGTVPAPGSGIPLPLASNGALAYNTKTGLYTLIWKPQKREQNCRLVSVKLRDGTIHTARFQLQ